MRKSICSNKAISTTPKFCYFYAKLDFMFLKRLSLINFRNFESLEYEASPRINWFTGNNGVGKTNILDAIHYLSFSKSFISTSDKLNITHGCDMFLVQGEYVRNRTSELVYCALKSGQKKVFKRNGKEYSKMADHIGVIPLVYSLPSDSNLIFAGSDVRRRFIDMSISQFDSNYLNNIITYNRALEQRNKLLKDLATNTSFDKDSFDVWDEILAAKSTAIFSIRRDFIAAFEQNFQQYFNQISTSSERVSLQYRSQLWEHNPIDLLRKSMKRDMALQYTTTGIHKDDLVFGLNDYMLKNTGSQGQQKSYLAALKFAQYDFIKNKTGLEPILLLDDIFDKLDNNRVEQIIHIVSGQQFGQIFITHTDEARITGIMNNIHIDNNILKLD